MDKLIKRKIGEKFRFLFNTNIIYDQVLIRSEQWLAVVYNKISKKEKYCLVHFTFTIERMNNNNNNILDE